MECTHQISMSSSRSQKTRKRAELLNPTALRSRCGPGAWVGGAVWCVCVVMVVLCCGVVWCCAVGGWVWGPLSGQQLCVWG